MLLTQLEIDEYRDYDKALGALRESHKCLAKAQADTRTLEARVKMIEDFVAAKALVKTDQDMFVRSCEQLLLDAPRLEAAVYIVYIYIYIYIYI